MISIYISFYDKFLSSPQQVQRPAENRSQPPFQDGRRGRHILSDDRRRNAGRLGPLHVSCRQWRRLCVIRVAGSSHDDRPSPGPAVRARLVDSGSSPDGEVSVPDSARLHGQAEEQVRVWWGACTPCVFGDGNPWPAGQVVQRRDGDIQRHALRYQGKIPSVSLDSVQSQTCSFSLSVLCMGRRYPMTCITLSG